MRAVRVVRAAGGVVWRPADGSIQVVAVHRPRYDDWSLPKGKLAKGEHPLVGAVREVFEETGVHGVPQFRLPSTRYLTAVPGVEKLVDYWSMRLASSETFVPNDEVDEVRWYQPAEAAKQLTYGHDRGVLKAFLDRPAVTGEVVLVRHAEAGNRDEWDGPDAERPLDASGQAEAAALAVLLGVFRPARLVSASPLRCIQTFAPLAATLDCGVEVDERFDESADPAQTVDALLELAQDGSVSAVCSQRGVIPPAVAALDGSADAAKYATAKGNGWILLFGRPGLVAAERLGLRPS
jgi:8-oxo-dGTP diphosphatase